MKQTIKLLSISAIASLAAFTSCDSDDKGSSNPDKETIDTSYTFSKNAIAKVGLGDGVPEISAYDVATKKIFSTNADANEVDVINISDLNAPVVENAISISPFGGGVNSVSVNNEMLAIAVEGEDKQKNKGRVVVFKTDNLSTPVINVEAGYLPDMVTFSPDGKYILVANEGEPNDTVTIDPIGSVGIIEIATGTYTDLNFSSFNNQEAALEAKGFRVFGETRIPDSGNPDKDAPRTPSKLDADVEPEYITVSSDSKTAYVALQENNGIAVVDITTKEITKIIPLGTKDYSEFLFDVSDETDDKIERKKWPVKGFYQPDAIDYFEIGGTGYLISANEGDGREYLDDKGTDDEDDDVVHLIDEARVSKVDLDETVFPNAKELQDKENLGRLKIVTTSGDTDGDGDYDELFTFGGRSFTIWSTSGDVVYDSGDFLTEKTIELGSYPDGRSDAKGTEPEAVTTAKIGDKTLAFVGLERSGNVFIFDISTPSSPEFLQNLDNTSPEGLLVINAKDSPNGKTLLVVSNEFPDDATLNIFSAE